MRPSISIASLILLAIAILTYAGALASAGNYSYDVPEGMCVQVGSVNGGDWSMTSSAPFQGRVLPSNGAYSYGPRIGAAHQGTGPGGANYYYTACNVCPVGTITVDFAIPDPAINGGAASRFPSQNVDTSACSGGPSTDFDFDLGTMPQVLGGLGFLVALLVLIVVILFPAPAGPPVVLQAQAQPPWLPGPRLAPVPWIDPVAGPPRLMSRDPTPLNPAGWINPIVGAPTAIAKGAPQLVPTGWIGLRHPVPSDAPPQAVQGDHPRGSRVICPAPPGCGQLTLTLFAGGWFCTNVQCPLRLPGTGQTTTFIDMAI